MGVITKLFGTHSVHELKRIAPIVDKIESYKDLLVGLTDEQLRAKTDEFKGRLQNGETLDDILPEAFAVVREASRRVLGMEHFRVQLIGGIILHQGRIADMKTGEGKTLVCTLPAYLNALEGKGVCVVTVNDYLAKRDAEWMGDIHRFLGLSVGCVLQPMKPDERKIEYQCDITYITNNELGFDYLRDNMVTRKEDLVQRGLHYCIIDEIDSILIDEARTPLIISGQSGKSTRIYEACDILAKYLERGEASGELTKIAAISGEEITETGDFIVNEKDKIVTLTQQGIEKTEKFFHIENYSDAEHIELQHNVDLALRANYIIHRDQDYVVKDNEILIVDDFTGRIMPGRRYSDGLHQAIEAKEHVRIKQESKTLATITFQNFFNKFDKKCGMTGTAQTEEQEFRDIYGMDVVCVPTNKPVIRQDMEDAVFKTKKEKYQAVVEAVKESHAKGQPVLVGTITIDVSEHISKLLRNEHIQHNVLNAKYHELEAEIVAQAGQAGSVTIATNMAGRGTDIKLDEVAREAGGLRIIGTERHESRRIDNQLRGRSGRQGDPGESRFYISLEDDLMRLFGSERMVKTFDAFGIPEGEEIEHKMLSSAIERAQRKIESNNFGIRKNMLEFDQVNNDQREIFYEQRMRILGGEDLRDEIIGMIDDVVERKIRNSIAENTSGLDMDMNALGQMLVPIISVRRPLEEDVAKMDQKALAENLKEEAKRVYKEIEDKMETCYPGMNRMRELERAVFLRVIDARWMNHIDDMEQLRQSIGLSAYAQRDPKAEYRTYGFELFEEMTEHIQDEVLRTLCHIKIEPPKETVVIQL